MGLITRLFSLTPPTFKSGFCPRTWQQLADALIGGTQVTQLVGTPYMYFNFGGTTPGPDFRIYPWLNTNNGLWWTFQFGLWTNPMNPSERESSFRKVWKPGAGIPENALWSLDGGDGTDPSVTAPTAISGAAWEVDHDLDGRTFFGIGAIPGSDPAASITSGASGGEGSHVQTEDELVEHYHKLSYNNDSDHGSGGCESGYNTLMGGEVDGSLFVTDGISCTETVNAAKTGGGKAFGLMPPYWAGYWIKPTARTFYVLPA